MPVRGQNLRRGSDPERSRDDQRVVNEVSRRLAHSPEARSLKTSHARGKVVTFFRVIHRILVETS